MESLIEPSVIDGLTRSGPNRRRHGLGLVAVALLIASLVSGCRPVTTPLVRGGRVLIIGDSLTKGAAIKWQPEMAPGRPVDFDAATGRLTTQAAARLKALDLQRYDQIIIGLGTNDYVATEKQMGIWIDKTMAAAGDRRVTWVNIDTGQRRLREGEAVNRAINQATARHPNLTVADWNLYLGSRPDAARSRAADGLHYTAAGYQHLAEFHGRLATGTVTLVRADKTGQVSASLQPTSCPGVTIQLRRPDLAHPKLSLTTASREIGSSTKGQVLEFFIQSTGPACSFNWNYDTATLD